MKQALLLLILIAVSAFTGTAAPSPNVVISQVYGGAATGTSTSTYANDYVEIFNRGNSPVSIGGWSVQYGSATGTSWAVTTLPAATLNPGQYFLIKESAGSAGLALPTPDATGSISMSATNGKVALVNNSTALVGNLPTDASLVDLIGYGTANGFEGSAAAPALSITTAAFRAGNGCTDTDQNATDFATAAPLPRNSATATNVCSGGGGDTVLSASAAANPNPVTAGATTLLTVTVRPASNPISTGIAVVGDLSSIGGSSAQTFRDDGTNGDATAGDNIFSYQASIAATAATGSRALSFTVSDAQQRSAQFSFTLNVNNSSTATADYSLLLGNPSKAVSDVNQPLNYLIARPQYSLSYNRDNVTPNWVAWRLDSTWLGSAARQDDYRPDDTLPAGWYRATPADYSGSGYTRGHMCPSGDRTRSVPDNSATFIMTNFVPQTASNNNGTWNEMENYLRSLVQAGNTVYTYDGGAGSLGKIGSGCGTANGCINIPAVTWKVAVVLPNGDNDVQRVNKTTRVIAVIVPNTDNTNINWRLYRKTVRQVEAITGLNFFSNVRGDVRQILKRRLDNQ